MRDRQAREETLAARRETDQHLSPVGPVPRAADETARLHAVDQLDGAVVAELEALGEGPDRRSLPAGHAAHGEEELVLLGCQPGRARRPLAEAEESTHVIAKLRESAVFGGGHSAARHPRDSYRITM